MSPAMPMTWISFIKAIFPTCADEYNSVTTDKGKEDLRNKFSIMCAQFRDNIRLNELSEDEQKTFELVCPDISLYLDHIKKTYTQKNDPQTYVNSSCNYFFYKLKFLINSCNLKCGKIESCYTKMREYMKSNPPDEDAFDICANEQVYEGIVYENIFGMMKYIDLAFYSLYHLKSIAEYRTQQKAMYLNFIKQVLQVLNSQRDVFPKIYQRIKDEYDEIIQKVQIKTQQVNTDDQSSQGIATRDSVHVYRAHITFLKHKTRNIMKIKNKQNENMVNSSATLEGIYNDSIDNKYSLAYSSEGY
ncbi:variable surface protein [Plasmodium gonderi]|uniref:Variable surface protein n=1 Tax=Plasmodium gonderi TaxID=77519 RepID=A0A1Y1JP46_PLAGO|nr:variable surface protein [Plasmodium gonderi]GAW84239.1 variable surface protein [Plasmodium gonderi]